MHEELNELLEKSVKMAEKLHEVHCDSVTKDDFPELFDIVKDIAETKKYLAETCYYHTVVEAMESKSESYSDWGKYYDMYVDKMKSITDTSKKHTEEVQFLDDVWKMLHSTMKYYTPDMVATARTTIQNWANMI